MRYYPSTGDLHFDILTRLGEAATFESVESEIKAVEGIRVRVATPEALYRLKRNTVRPVDRQDAAALPGAVQSERREGLIMPVQKFRSIDEMNAAQVLTSADEAFNRFVRHCARYRAVAPRS